MRNAEKSCETGSRSSAIVSTVPPSAAYASRSAASRGCTCSMYSAFASE